MAKRTKNSDVAKNNLIEILEHRIKELEIQNEKLEAKAENAIEAYKSSEKDLIQYQIENAELRATLSKMETVEKELKARLENAVELPCKVGGGDTVWCIRAYGKGYQIEENSVMEIVFEYGNNMKIKTSRGLFGYDKWTYGLDCFTDRSEAESRLAELKRGRE